MHHIIDHWSGGDGGFVYCLYSGLLALIGLGVVSTVLRIISKHTQCHDDSCHKPGVFKIAGGEHRVCRAHYLAVSGHPPDHTIDVAHLRAKHERHLARDRVL